MIKCDTLVSALKGQYTGSYEDFEKSIINFIETNMKFISNSDATCEIVSSASYGGETIGCELIKINKKVIIDLMNGDKTKLIVIFHELSHVVQNIYIKNGENDPEIILYIKDLLLNQYQFEENHRFHFDSNMSYYDINYVVDSREVDANMISTQLAIQFLKENNIDIDNKDALYFANIIKQNSSEKKKRYVGGCCSFNDYYLSLDEAFDVAIKHHPEWLDEYPQLSAQYYRVGDKVFKIKDSVYDENKDISAHQLKQRRL